ncbi:MAG: ABC transporter ATP-binding protein [Halolamina sp.]|uniref:ABC transporter ATP-binding protein n=1 Tax=Halolamina sp. TaxID=1940283 RepID=UPI002FC3A439
MPDAESAPDEPAADSERVTDGSASTDGERTGALTDGMGGPEAAPATEGGSDAGTNGTARTESTTATSVQSEEETQPTVLELEDVVKQFGSETAVEGVDLSVREGELLTLLGPSGCGKTTTLRAIAGLEEPTAGTVSVAGVVVAGDGPTVPPEQRDVGMVFQEFALFPHLTVAENIAFGLENPDSDAADERVAELLDLVGLDGYGDRSPGDLSGGQRQRVALARSLAPEPDVLLLDEPFSNLDVRLRVEMREEVTRILDEAGVTAVSVTHDQEEALSISDRVAVMHDGHVEQVGTPAQLFEQPKSRFVASFLGQASFLPGRVGEETVETDIGSYSRALLKGISDEYAGVTVDVLVRPDDLRLTPVGEAEADGTVIRRQYTGPSFVYHVELTDGTVVRCLHNHAEVFETGEPVRVRLVADHTLAWYPTP